MKLILLLLAIAFGPTGNLPIDMSGDFSGTWEYTVNAPERAYQGAIVLEKTDDGYKGHIAAYGSNYEFSNIEVDGSSMKFDLLYEGTPVTISGTFDGDSFDAVANVDGMELPFVAKRKA